MTRTLPTLAAAASLAAAAVATPTPSEARCFGCAVGLGVLGGVIVGSAIANAARPYPPPPPEEGYVAYPGYAAAGPVGCPGGYWARRPLAFDREGNPIRWSRAHFFCP